MLKFFVNIHKITKSKEMEINVSCERSITMHGLSLSGCAFDRKKLEGILVKATIYWIGPAGL